MSDPRPILVVGATGMLGRPVVERLVAEGVKVRVLVRDPAKAHALFGDSVAAAQGDARDRGSVERAMAGTRAVHVSLRGTSLAEIESIEVTGTAVVATAAAQAGVERLTYLSGAGIQDGDPALLPVRIKSAAERAIAASEVRSTILRPTHFMESLDLFVRGKKAEILAPQPVRFHYLAADDYARQVARLLATPGIDAPELTLLGPEAYTMRQALAVYVRLLRPDLAIRETPLAMVKLIAAVTRNPELRLATALFDAFRRLPEGGDREQADRLVGPATTTLAEWCAQRRRSA